jgi:hypothetical protein
VPLLQLANEDARILALAIAYHLGRPGSETDPETLQRHRFGLEPVGDALGPQLHEARVELDVTPYQLHRLDVALLGITNELKQYEMAHQRSSVPGFASSVRLLFPDLASDRTADDAPTALDLVERVVMLRRRLASSVRGAEAALTAEREASEAARRQRRRWWQFWRRGPRGARP